MKSKILPFIIGVLIGAIITTVGFLIYNKTVDKNSNQPEMMQMDEDGQNEQPTTNGNMEEPPEKPSGDNGEEPPTKPEESNNNTNS